MEKLFNWTIGSFFRTIGRLIAYFAIGAIIAYLLANSNLNLGGITNLFFTRVDAMSLDGHYDRQININSARQRVNLDESNEEEFINFSTTFTANGSSYGVITFSGLTFSISELNNDATYSYMMSLAQTYIQVYIMSNGAWQSCEIQNNLIVCSLAQNATYTGLWVRVSPATTWNYHDWYVELELNNYISLYSTDTQAVIDNNNQNHNETMSVITDTNTTSESNETTNYILEQQDDTPSGLTSAVTSPLRIIDNAISGTASPLCFNLNGKQSCLPTGSIIWNHQFGEHRWFSSGYSNPLQTFIAFFNLVVAGYLCYKMLVSMLRIFNDALDPTISKIEVMKL